MTSRSQVVGAGVACLIVAAFVLLGAAAPSRLPLYVVAGTAGALLLMLPLQLFPASQPLAVAGWVGLFAITAVWREGLLPSHAEQLIVFGAVGLLLTGLVFAVSFENEGALVADRDAQRLLGSLMVVAGSLFVLRLLLDVGAESGALTGGVSGGLVTAALAVLMLALLLGLIVAIARGVSGVHVDREFERPPRPLRPTLARLSPPSPLGPGILMQVAHVVAVIGVRVATFVLAGVEQLAAAGLWALHLIKLAALYARHQIQTLCTWLWRVAVESVKELVVDIRGSFVIIASVVRQWVLTAVLATVVVTAGAVLAVVASAWFQSYLLGGAVWKGPLALIFAAVAVSGLIVVWWALTKRPWSQVQAAAAHNSENGGPSILIALIAIGWIDGIAGISGLGPVRPGMMTMTGTVVLIVVTFIVLGKSRRRASDFKPDALAREPS